jgi:hypothetical protein
LHAAKPSGAFSTMRSAKASAVASTSPAGTTAGESVPRDEGSKVLACAERAFARTGDHHGAHLRVGLGFDDRRADAGEESGRERVAGVWPVQAHDHDLPDLLAHQLVHRGGCHA